MTEAVGSAIIERRSGPDDKPSVTYRAAGDQFVLAEFGEMEFDLTLNFFVLAFDKALRDSRIEGLIETSPGFRSILVSYESLDLSPHELIEDMNRVYESVPSEHGLTVPSRLIHLPIAFDDSQTQEAVQRYQRIVRADAPNAEGGTNIDYCVSYNGLKDREELYEQILATEWWNAFTGFFPGLPFMFPLDPRYILFVPKYNPTRTWTPEGAVGIGGPCVAIYPVESPGGYQLFGRTLPIYDLKERNSVFRGKPILINPGDRVHFHRVSEEELLSFWEDVHADRYRYRMEESPFKVGAYLESVDGHRAEAEEARRRRESAAAVALVP